jgi:hypothetical protein
VGGDKCEVLCHTVVEITREPMSLPGCRFVGFRALFLRANKQGNDKDQDVRPAA